MISGSLRPRKTAAAQIAPTELPASASECIPLCRKVSPCSMQAEERMRNMFVRPMHQQMAWPWNNIVMPSSPEALIYMQQHGNFIDSKNTESPITAVKQKRRALLFDGL